LGLALAYVSFQPIPIPAKYLDVVSKYVSLTDGKLVIHRPHRNNFQVFHNDVLFILISLTMYAYGNAFDRSFPLWGLLSLPIFGFLGQVKVLECFVVTPDFFKNFDKLPPSTKSVVMGVGGFIALQFFYQFMLAWYESELLSYLALISFVPFLYITSYQYYLPEHLTNIHVHHWFVGFYMTLISRYDTYVSNAVFTIFWGICMEGALTEGIIPILTEESEDEEVENEEPTEETYVDKCEERCTGNQEGIINPACEKCVDLLDEINDYRFSGNFVMKCSECDLHKTICECKECNETINKIRCKFSGHYEDGKKVECVYEDFVKDEEPKGIFKDESINEFIKDLESKGLLHSVDDLKKDETPTVTSIDSKKPLSPRGAIFLDFESIYTNIPESGVWSNVLAITPTEVIEGSRTLTWGYIKKCYESCRQEILDYLTGFHDAVCGLRPWHTIEYSAPFQKGWDDATQNKKYIKLYKKPEMKLKPLDDMISSQAIAALARATPLPEDD